jgi:hypothetical protein
MFNNSGLSLDQAPPIEVVLRFFLVGSIFGVVASFMLFFWHNDLNNIYASTTLALIHTLTLGVMASFMLGALFQMMPVLCGVHIKAPVDFSIRVTYTLLVGVIFLITAFINGNSALYIFAAIFLAIAILSSAFVMIRRLSKINHSNSSRGMLIAIISFVIAVVLGIFMLTARAGFNIDIKYIEFRNIHFHFALFGWIAILIIAVAFQVIEMFYVTPKYNQKYAKYITILIFLLLLIYAILELLGFKISTLFSFFAVALISFNAVVTIIKIKQKKRPVNDASIWFWVNGMASLALFALFYFFNFSALFLAILFSSFALSIIFAMSYKIIPFLVWFHLNAKGYFDAPMMHEVVSAKYAKVNFWFFLSAEVILLTALKFKILFYFGSFLLLIAFCMLSLAIYRAWEKYNFTIKYGKKFNF